MATQAELRQRVRDKLYGAYSTDRSFHAELGASYTSAPATILVDDGTNWSGGDILENQATGEQFYVKSVSTNTLTVISGFNGTTEAASSGSDDLIVKNPRYKMLAIDDALNSALQSLDAWGVHGFANGSFVRNDMQRDFWELSETDIHPIYGVLEAYYVETNTDQPRPLPFRYRQELGTDPTEYTQGRGLLMLDFGNVKETESVYYTYAQVYDILSEPAGGEQEELLVLGATSLMLGGQISPSSQDPGARTDRTVPVGQVGRDVRYFQGEFFQRVRAEAAKVGGRRQKFHPSTVRTARARRWVN